ncbi:MAG: GxxExxY protein [Verrucomicrobia bacterium]|nr:GxxExxY protein [Verrucomicrobiota bacterium]MBU1910400.1 GxxExxY protein [Verrucomicrobiota bacterium]
MHPKYQKAHELSSCVIGAGMEVHRALGPGLLETVYEKCLMRELELQGLAARQQTIIPVEYKGLKLDECLRSDIVVEDCLIVEVKAVEGILPIHKAQVLTYMKLLDTPLGLLMNFHSETLKQGLVRLVLKGASD